MKTVLIIALLFSTMTYAAPEPCEATARKARCEAAALAMDKEVRINMQKALREKPENYWNILTLAGVPAECILADKY